ncbi:radical SAM/SPASM domain-containing protein [Fusobacterium russii]|uniref:radical SAM/SPASM domain-containing protein n=1 Tax=Fusobacterium russii TaxID=854 RepID=UPI00039D7F28|nr:radical SAM protein [Fusobacterium russii]
MKNNRQEKIKYLVLWVADSCNLNCKYCYASPNFSNKLMTFEIAKKAIELYADKSFTLILAGGEPLLNFPLIEEVYNYIKNNKAYKVKIGMQTNGTLISERIAKKLSEMDINIGVSFDGNMEVNESLRGGTKETLRGIKLLGYYNKNINLNAVLNNKNINSLENLVDIAYYLGNVNAVGLDLLRVAGNCLKQENIEIGTADDEDIYINLKKANQRVQLLEKLTSKKVVIREIEDIKMRKCSACNTENYCYSSLGRAMVVTANGDTYPCSSFVGNKDYYMGNINDEISIKKLNSGKYERCIHCEYQKICKGCCPSRMIFNEEYGLEDKDCVLRKAIFKILEENEGRENFNA